MVVLVKEQETNFEELFEDGICTGIVRWAKERGKKTKCETRVLVKRLRKEFPGIEIGLGTSGNLVVFEVGKYTNGDYKFRRGLQNSKSKVKQRVMEEGEG